METQICNRCKKERPIEREVNPMNVLNYWMVVDHNKGESGRMNYEEVRLRGVGVSAGISRGTVFIHYPEDEELPKNRIDNSEIPGEIARFEAALVATRAQILEMQQKIAEAIGAKDASIFDAHLLVVEDRTLIDEVLRTVQRDLWNVEFVFSEVANRYARTLTEIADPYLRERGFDIHDVAKRIIRNLLGRSGRPLAQMEEPHIIVAYNLTCEVIEAREGDSVRYLDRAKDLARFGLAEGRRTALSLHPFILDKIGLTETIAMLVERSNVPGRLQCSLSANDSRANDLPLETQQNLLRIAQEAISNAFRHAQPTTISVSLQTFDSSSGRECDRCYLELQVQDNGRGISAPELMSRHGFGLINMQNRAKKIGASLDIRTNVGRGTAIVVRLSINA